MSSRTSTKEKSSLTAPLIKGSIHMQLHLLRLISASYHGTDRQMHAWTAPLSGRITFQLCGERLQIERYKRIPESFFSLIKQDSLRGMIEESYWWWYT